LRECNYHTSAVLDKIIEVEASLDLWTVELSKRLSGFGVLSRNSSLMLATAEVLN
jgi:hypothetical protein